MFAVTPKTNCPHIPVGASHDQKALDDVDVHIPCSRCKDKNENWICLTCWAVSCSRHVHGHAAEHYHESKHPVAASFSDFSFWCYECDSYIVHKNLDRVKEAMHCSKFPEGATSSSTGIIADSSSSAHESQDDGPDDNSYDPNSPPSDDFIIPPTELMKTILGMGGRPPQITVPPPPHVLPSLDLAGIAEVIKGGKCKKIILCTGAGISVAAGIPDFRSPGTGLYDNLQKYNLPHPTAVFELDYFRQRPEPFYTLAKELYPGNFKPTACHHFVKLLNQKGLLLRNFTQNIDTLERIAGVPEDKLVEAHGSFASAHCIACRLEYSQDFVKKAVFYDQLPRCTICNELVKPDITFFGEQLPKRFYDCVMDDFNACDLLIVIGTSLQVQPFASLITFVDKRVPRLLINREKVARYNPLMALLGGPVDGFLFDEACNYRDVYCGGEIQDNIKKLAALLGWEAELNALITATDTLVPAAAAKSP